MGLSFFHKEQGFEVLRLVFAIPIEGGERLPSRETIAVVDGTFELDISTCNQGTHTASNSSN